MCRCNNSNQPDGTNSLLSNTELNNFKLIPGWFSSRHIIISLLTLSIPRAFPGIRIVEVFLSSSKIIMCVCVCACVRACV